MIFNYDLKNWLPTTKKEVLLRGWSTLDVILFTGDAYVDHPAFGVSIIGRLLEKMGLKVGIVPQPNWQDDLRDFKKLGTPNLFFGVTSGNMDSMVNHYTAAKRLRSNDAFTPGGQSGFRPDRATTVYTQIVKQLYPDVPVIIGGIEASLRRLTHYDYWDDTLHPSILTSSGADMLIYGMAEKSIESLVQSLISGRKIKNITDIPQTGFVTDQHSQKEDGFGDTIYLASHSKCVKDKMAYCENFIKIEKESNRFSAKRIIQPHSDKLVIINPPFELRNEKEMDEIYDLPYTRLPHPKYQKRGEIPAWKMIKDSITIHRGCFGGCSFCTISAHQGKFIQSRSEESIEKEATKILNSTYFKGVISDLGGPSANMYKMSGKDLSICKKCVASSCIFPKICRNLHTSHKHLLELYRKIETLPEIKHVFIGSGIRYDLLIQENGMATDNTSREYLSRLVSNHVSGRLKVAPEHTESTVLKIMRKPSFRAFEMFKNAFDKENKKQNKKQYIIPYFISSHPGCQEIDMAHLALKTKKLGFRLEQVQDLTPTPMTLAAVMYHTGIDPYTKRKLFVAKTKKDKEIQNMYFFWYKGDKQRGIKQRLQNLGRSKLADRLIGKKP